MAESGFKPIAHALNQYWRNAGSQKHRFYNRLNLCLKCGSACADATRFRQVRISTDLPYLQKWDHSVSSCLSHGCDRPWLSGCWRSAWCLVCLRMAVQVTTSISVAALGRTILPPCLQLSGRWPHDQCRLCRVFTASKRGQSGLAGAE